MNSSRFIAILTCFFVLACSTNPLGPVKRSSQSLLLIHSENPDPTWKSIIDRWESSARESGLQVTTTDAFSALSEEKIKHYSTVVLLNIKEEELAPHHHSGIQRYVEAGGGLCIVDSTSTTPHLWDWYREALQAPLLEGDKAAEYRLVQDKMAVVNLSVGSQYLENPPQDIFTYLVGDNTYNYSHAVSFPAPDEDRFTRVILDDDIYEPMEMVILPKSLKVLFLERRGRMKLYDPAAKSTKVVAEFDVCITGNYEDGLHGVALDPKYGEENHWIYVYYSPGSDCTNPNQTLSRFEFRNDSLIWASEVELLHVEVQRETCCHSGGSVEFGPDGLLYLSTGDNTSSKESDGYTPIDEQPGRAPFDAQKSSGNTHDLRGKILRIKPTSEGGYTIPDGNLFPKDGSKGRPEIYTMGCRNPFRIHIDAKTNWLYWGDVGPDVGRDGRYGPQSYDEWNLAKKAGNFGWPYFVGNNFAYPDRDFATDAVGALFDPEKPINESPNNTGARELPPATPAWMWYPYGVSDTFPLLGQGSRSAMAGPVYYEDQSMSTSQVKFPEYYNGKFFIYEWARSWIMVCHLDEDGALTKMEPFMPSTRFSKPIDIEFGPDGALYILEYGNQYFANNPDAKLSRIEYAEGNRVPVAEFVLDKPYGSSPHTITLDGKNSYDYDKEDSLQYTWSLDGDEVESGIHASLTIAEKGSHKITLQVTDPAGATASTSKVVKVGNAPPSLAINLSQNRSFYFPGSQSFDYTINISDPEDEAQGGIDPKRSFVSMTYLNDESLLYDLLEGKAALPQTPAKHLEGYYLIKGSDCFTCHAEDKTNIGPSYQEVAKRYTASPDVITHLASKIIEGGNGVWGEKIMSAHPQLALEDAETMVKYILSLKTAGSLPLEGRVALVQHDNQSGGYLFSASYEDLGSDQVENLTSREVLFLRSPRLTAEYMEVQHGDKSKFGPNREFTSASFRNNGWLKIPKADLSHISKLRVHLRNRISGNLQLVKGTPDGPLVSEKFVAANDDRQWTDWKDISLTIETTESSVEDLYVLFDTDPFFFLNDEGAQVFLTTVDIDYVHFSSSAQNL